MTTGLSKKRKPAWLVLGGFFCSFFSACSLQPLQSDKILEHKPNDIRQVVEIHNTPFNPQQRYQCGPAALATMLQFNGLQVHPDQLVTQVYLPERKGSLQLELLASARRHGLLPYRVDKHMQVLLAEVDAGHPVLVLQNLGFSWRPQWHYAVVIGYDLAGNKIILRSGTRKRHIVSLQLFERTWRRADYWAVLVLPVTRLPATATAFSYLKSALVFEKVGKADIALRAYETALTKWPDDKALLMAAGNNHFRLKQSQAAKVYFRKIINKWPNYGPALNNLANILADEKKYAEAERMVMRAIDYGGRFKSVYQETWYKIKRLKAATKSPAL